VKIKNISGKILSRTG